MIYKIILSGRLDFGNEKTFAKVLQMYQYRVENFYKTDLLIKEDAFEAENFFLNVPRTVLHADEKNWNNTVKLLRYLAQFAVSSTMKMWLIDESGDRKHVEHISIEPETDKVAVQEFIKGRQLIDQSGKETEAIDALNKAIEKYERHALAYERRGYVNYQLRNFNDALYDFTKSIDLNPNNAEPFFGRALVKIYKDDLKGAVADLDQAAKNAIPLQPMYWKIRRIKGEAHLKLEEYEEAVKEFKFVTTRQYEPEDPNFKWSRSAFFNYGKALMEVKNYSDALRAFDNALKAAAGKETFKEAEILVLRGIVAQKAGKDSYKKDWQDAVGLGSAKAAELLATVS